MPNPGLCSGCGRILPFGQTTCPDCTGEAWRNLGPRTSARVYTWCAHVEECPVASDGRLHTCYYEDHPDVTPLT